MLACSFRSVEQIRLVLRGIDFLVQRFIKTCFNFWVNDQYFNRKEYFSCGILSLAFCGEITTYKAKQLSFFGSKFRMFWSGLFIDISIGLKCELENNSKGRTTRKPGSGRHNRKLDNPRELELRYHFDHSTGFSRLKFSEKLEISA